MADLTDADVVTFVTFDPQGRVLTGGMRAWGILRSQLIGRDDLVVTPSLNLLRVDEWYVNLETSQAVKREPNPTVLIDGQLKNVPLPCRIAIDDKTYEVDESTIDLELTQPGKYEVRVQPVAFLDATFTVTIDG